MAEIFFEDLIDLLNSKNNQRKMLATDIPPKTAFYIKFSEGKSFKTENYETSSGNEILLDFDKNNNLLGLEFY